MTNIEFAKRAIRLAAVISAWAADCIDFDERREEPMRDEPLELFLRDMRGRLDHIERCHKEAA